MVMLISDAGLCRSEISLIRTNDVIDDLLRKSLIEHVKGKKDRVVLMTEELIQEFSRLPEDGSSLINTVGISVPASYSG